MTAAANVKESLELQQVPDVSPSCEFKLRIHVILDLTTFVPETRQRRRALDAKAPWTIVNLAILFTANQKDILPCLLNQSVTVRW